MHILADYLFQPDFGVSAQLLGTKKVTANNTAMLVNKYLFLHRLRRNTPLFFGRVSCVRQFFKAQRIPAVILVNEG